MVVSRKSPTVFLHLTYRVVLVVRKRSMKTVMRINILVMRKRRKRERMNTFRMRIRKVQLYDFAVRESEFKMIRDLKMKQAVRVRRRMNMKVKTRTQHNS